MKGKFIMKHEKTGAEEIYLAPLENVFDKCEALDKGSWVEAIIRFYPFYLISTEK